MLQMVDGDFLTFAYEQGQNMMITDSSTVPRFTGRHRQPQGYRLKYPEAGDLILFEGTDQQRLVRWGYLTHYEMLTGLRPFDGDSNVRAA
jgi:hypothetical protein